MKKLLLIASVSLFSVSPVMAKDLSIGAQVSTLGAGLNIGYQLTDSIDVKAEFNGYTYDYSGTEENIDYDFELNLKNQGLLVNWHPFKGGMRLTAGAYHNGNSISGDADYMGSDSLDIGGTNYSGADIGSMDTDIEFNSIAPYLGIGYAAEMGSFELGFDVGVLFQGSPSVSLNVRPNASMSQSDQNTLLINAERERKNLESELEDMKYYPVAKLSLSYNF